MSTHSLRKHVVLMVQCPIDVPFVLEYVYRSAGNRLTLIIVGSQGLYTYLERLGLDAELIFIRPEARAEPLTLYLKRLRQQRRRLWLLTPDVQEIRYCSEYQDFVTACYLDAHRRGAEIVKVATEIDGLERFAEQLSPRQSLIACMFALVIRTMLGLRVFVFRVNGQFVFKHLAPYARREVLAPSAAMFSRFSVAMTTAPGVNVLLFESNGQEDHHFLNYEAECCLLIGALQSIGTVHVKPHPTRGFSRMLEQAGVRVIAAEVPASLLQLDFFDLIVGIDSAALREVRHPRVVSVIDSFSFRSETGKTQIKAYLRQGNGKHIVFSRTEELFNGF